MADRELPELRSRLRMDTSDLDRAGQKVDQFRSRLGKSVPAPNVDWSGFESRLRKNADDFEKFGRKATLGVTLPLVAAGAASVKLANDFDSTFQRMVSLAGVAADEVDGLKESVKALAAETGKSPQDLAEGLEVIRSAGVTGAQAMEVLATSAKASAIGLGTTREVADVVTSALNAYGSEAMSAAEATDILAASVEVAKVEAADMAPQLGRLLPLASTLGVEFNEVAGALAFLTQTGLGADAASTELAGIFQKLLKPGADAQKVLAAVGLSVDEVKQTLSDQGLIAALQLLDQSFGGNKQTMAQFFEDSQAITGVLSILADNGVKAGEAIDYAGSQTGKTSGAFAAFSETDAAKMQKALAELQTAMIELGSSLAPTVASLASSVGDIAKAFRDLPGPAQQALIAVAGLFALLGPVSSSIGKVANNLDRLQSIARRGAPAVDELGKSTEAAGQSAGTAGTAFATAATGVVAFITSFVATTSLLNQLSDLGTTKVSLDGLAASFELLATKGKIGGEFAEKFGANLEDLAGQIKSIDNSTIEKLNGSILGLDDATDSIDGVDKALAELAKTDPTKAAAVFGQISAALIGQGVTAEQIGRAFGDYNDAVDNAAVSAEAATGATDGLTSAQAGLGPEIQANIDAALGQGAATETVVQSLLKAIDATDAFVSAQGAAEDAIAAVAENEKAAAGNSEEAARLRADAAKQAKRDAQAIADATDAVVDAEKGVQDAVEARAQAVADAADAQKRVNELEADSLQLKKDLADATATYTERLNEQKNAARSDALSVEEALARVQDAQDALTNSEGDDFETTKNEQRLLEIDLIRAQDALDAAKKKAEQAKADADAAEAAGAAGDPVIQAAQAAVDENAQAIDDAKGSVLDAQKAVEDADARVVEAHKAVGRAAQDVADAEATAADHRAETAAKIQKLQDDAITKSGELKQAAKDAVKAFALAAEKAGVPVDAIAQGIEKLKNKSIPELQALLVPLLEGLNQAVNTPTPASSAAPLPSSVPTGNLNSGSAAGNSNRSGFAASRIASPRLPRVPSLVGAGVSSGPSVVVNLTVGGDLGAAQKMELHRIASEAVRSGIARSAADRGSR